MPLRSSSSAPTIVTHRHDRPQRQIRREDDHRIPCRAEVKNAVAAARLWHRHQRRQEQLRRKHEASRFAQEQLRRTQGASLCPSLEQLPRKQEPSKPRRQAKTTKQAVEVISLAPAPAVEPAVKPEECYVPQVAKPLSKGKKQDFGFGVPRWSPYWNPQDYKPVPRKPISATYGAFSIPGNGLTTLSPEMQLRENIQNTREMKGWAVVDHTWELVGERPHWANDLDFIGVSPTRVDFQRSPALSEDKKRDYGYGVPKWSPYYYPKNRGDVM